MKAEVRRSGTEVSTRWPGKDGVRLSLALAVNPLTVPFTDQHSTVSRDPRNVETYVDTVLTFATDYDATIAHREVIARLDAAGVEVDHKAIVTPAKSWRSVLDWLDERRHALIHRVGI